MSDFGVAGGIPRSESWGVVSGSSGGTTVSAATANIYGSWVQLKASTGLEATSLIITIADPNGNDEIKVDIGIGASGSEVVIAESLFFRADGYLRNNGMTYSLPLRVPAGTRVAARMRSASASRSCQVSVRALAGDSSYNAFERLEPIGGAYVATPGYTGHTKGAWSQLVAASAANYKALHIVFGLLDYVSSQTSCGLLDLGVGAAGSEVIIVPDLHVTAHNLPGYTHNTYQQAFVQGSVPYGIRLSCRGQVSAGNAARHMAMFLYGYL